MGHSDMGYSTYFELMYIHIPYTRLESRVLKWQNQGAILTLYQKNQTPYLGSYLVKSDKNNNNNKKKSGLLGEG